VLRHRDDDRLDEAFEVRVAHPDRLVVCAGVECDLLVRRQGTAHVDGQVVEIAERRRRPDLAIGTDRLDVILGRDDSTSSLDIPDEDVDQICLGDGFGGFSCSDFENIQEFPVSIIPIDEGLLTVGGHPVLCLPDGTTFACHRMDDPNRPLMADDRGFDLFPMWHMDVALMP